MPGLVSSSTPGHCGAYPVELGPSAGSLGNPFPASAAKTDSAEHTCMWSRTRAQVRRPVHSTRMSQPAGPISLLDCERRDPLLPICPPALGVQCVAEEAASPHVCPAHTSSQKMAAMSRLQVGTLPGGPSAPVSESPGAELSPAACPSATAGAEQQTGAVSLLGTVSQRHPRN